MSKKIWLSSFLLLVILSASIYIMMPDKVKIVVENTNTKFYVWEDEEWILGGTEYVNLFDGTTKMRAKSRDVSYNTIGDITEIIRLSQWKDNITTIDTYTFDSTIEDVERVPVKHTVECYNCQGRIVHFEYRDIEYTGLTRVAVSPESFGHNMKVEWQDGAYYSKLFQQKVASDKLIIRYRPVSSYETYEVRMFDPVGATMCYQEYANISTSCGGLATGNYNFTNELNDGDWNTGNLVAGIYHINYSKPTTANSDSKWQIKDKYYNGIDFITTTVNLTIQSACWTQDILQFQAERTATEAIWSCYNGTAWYAIRSNGVSFAPLMYEEAIYWNITLQLDIEGFSEDIDVELGSVLNVTGYLGNDTVCIDVDHPSYGTNYSCGTYETSFNLNITWFRKTQFNNVTSNHTLLNLTYSSSSNNTIYLSAHEYDDITNLTLNLTGYESGSSFPKGVKIYVNDTLSNEVGDLEGTLTTFNDTESAKNASFVKNENIVVGYFSLPKNTTISSAIVTITGYNNTYIQETADKTDIITGGTGYMTLEYNKSNRTFQYWDFKIGTLERYNRTLPINCSEYNTSIVKLRFENGVTSVSAWCYNGTSWEALNSSSGSSSTYCSQGYQSTMYDNLYSTGSCICDLGVYYGWNYQSYCTAGTITYEDSAWWMGPATTPWIKVGTLNGSYNWNWTGQYTAGAVNVTSDFANSIQTYLSTCTADDYGYCTVPLTASSTTGGKLQISDINISYSIDVINPIEIDIDIVHEFLEDSDGLVNVPLVFESSQSGIIEVSDLKYDYKGGNDTIEVKAHNTDYSTNVSYNITYYYSGWDYTFPSSIDFIEFIPIQGPTQKNVTPYGQLSTIPILNITSEAYGGKNFNFTIQINESFSCVNDTVSQTYNKTAGLLLLNGTWIDYNSSVGYEESFSIYSWADFQCNYTNWYLWNPYWYLRACCIGCDICSDTVENIVEI